MNNEQNLFSINDDIKEKGYKKDIIGDYLIKKTIGEGTFSKVKLGINMFTGQRVAIKILDKKKLIEEEGIERITREIKILSELNHPNIIKIYKIIDDNKYYLIVMEYCEEGELFNYIVEKIRLSDGESAFFYYQLINAIEYLHLNGIAHRDLKPENILLGENHIIKLIDFGLSNYFDENKLLVTPCGSPCYASPEMIRGEDYNGAYNDIWATGIVLYAMLCGYLPFENEDNSKDNKLLFKKILSLRLDYPNYLSDNALDLLKKILVTDPDKRIKINEIKKHAFYLKGKKIFEQKQKSINFSELKLIDYHNINFHSNNNIIDNQEKFNKLYNNNILSKSKNQENKYNNIKKIFDSKLDASMKNKIELTSSSNDNVKKDNKLNKIHEYTSTENNINKFKSEGLSPINVNLLNSLNRKHKNLLLNNNTFEKEVIPMYNSQKKLGIVKNVTNLLSKPDNLYNFNSNLLTKITKKKEKSMDYPHKAFKFNLYNNLNNVKLNYKSPNKKPLIQLKLYNSMRKGRQYDTNFLNNFINKNNTDIKMNDKIIINLTNDEERNISLIRINHKNNDKMKYIFNQRLNTENKSENFPFINSNKNKKMNSPIKENELKNINKDKKYVLKNYNYKDYKENLNRYNFKNIYQSQNLINFNNHKI